MKKQIIILLLALLCGSSLSAQLRIVNPDSTVSSSVYAGMLSTVRYNLDITDINKSSDFRTGFKTVWKPSQKLEYSGFVTMGISDGEVSSIYSLRLKYTPVKRLLITAGLAPTLATEIRPEPITGTGQFEPWSLERFPGTAPGIKAKYFAQTFAVGIGIARRNGITEQHFSFDYGKLNVASFIRSGKVTSGVAWNGQKYYQFLAYDEAKVLFGITAFSLKLDSLNKPKWMPYCDFGYNTFTHEFIRLEVGLLKHYYFPKASGLFGISYCKEINSFKGYLFLHL